MNHCQHCHAKIGDFFLHNEPGGAFVPLSELDARYMVLIELPPTKKGFYLKGDESTSYPCYTSMYATKAHYNQVFNVKSIKK